jgi:hypothetical protein
MLPRLDDDDSEGAEPVDTSSKVFERIRSAHREVLTLYDIAQTIGTSLDLLELKCRNLANGKQTA